MQICRPFITYHQTGEDDRSKKKFTLTSNETLNTRSSKIIRATTTSLVTWCAGYAYGIGWHQGIHCPRQLTTTNHPPWHTPTCALKKYKNKNNPNKGIDTNTKKNYHFTISILTLWQQSRPHASTYVSHHTMQPSRAINHEWKASVLSWSAQPVGHQISDVAS